jgi:hypothetical protein
MTEIFGSVYTAVDAHITALISCVYLSLRASVGNSGSTGERIPEMLSSDSKRSASNGNFARPYANSLQRRIPWGVEEPMTVPPMRCFHMSHPGCSLTRRFPVVIVTVLVAWIAFVAVAPSYAGDGDGIGGFKYKIKMEGEEDTPVFVGTDLMLGSGVDEPSDNCRTLGKTMTSRSELNFWSDVVRFLAFLTIRR